MIIKNTSRYPVKEVRRLVRFALKGLGKYASRRLEVHVKNSKRAFAGSFYPAIPLCSSATFDRSFLIVARIGSEDKFPCECVYPSRKRCEKYRRDLRTWREALVSVIGHEYEHLRQWLKDKRFREDHAERRAYKTLKKFRER